MLFIISTLTVEMICLIIIIHIPMEMIIQRMQMEHTQ